MSAPPSSASTSKPTPAPLSIPQQPGANSVPPASSDPAQTCAPASAPPGPNAQGAITDPNGQSLLQQQQQQQQQGQQPFPPMQTGYPPPQQQQGQFAYPPMQQPGGYPPPQQPGAYPPQQQPGGYPPPQQQQYYSQFPPTQQPGQSPTQVNQGQYPPSPQAPPMGYNQYPTGQFPQAYPPMPQQPSSPYAPQQQQMWPAQPPPNWQQPPQNFGYNQPGYGYYPPPQSPYGTNGSYPPTAGQFQQSLSAATPATSFPTSTLPHIPRTIGYDPTFLEEAPPHMYPQQDCLSDVDLIVKAFSNKLNTDESALIQVLSRKSHPLEIASRKKAYKYKFPHSKHKSLLDVIENRTFNFSGGFKSLTHALVAGPLDLDVFLLRKAIKGVGTIEPYIDLVLLCRSNEDIKAIATRYREVSGSSRALVDALEGDLSGDIETVYKSIMRAERYWDDPTVPIPKDELERNVKTLYAALTGRVDIQSVITFFVHGSLHRLDSIAREWQRVTGQKPLLACVEEKVSGHLKDALGFILLTARDRTLALATLLDRALRSSSLGRKDEEITVNVVKLVWEDQLRVGSPKAKGGVYARGDFLKEVDEKYVERRKAKDSSVKMKPGALLAKIKSETSGDFQKFLVSLWENQR